MSLPSGLSIRAQLHEGFSEILSEPALHFIATLHREFNERRRLLLQKRQIRQTELDAGKQPDFLEQSYAIRAEKTWRVAAAPQDLQDRRVEITGPVDRKMIINAMNSGANIFMADFEDSNSPTWPNVVRGQINLRDAVQRTISFTNPDGKRYQLKDKTATLFVRPRGWHLDEKHVLVDGEPVCASIFDFGLFFFHNARTLVQSGSGPYFYLPKLESHLEARLWNDIFRAAQNALDIPQGSVRATVLIETILAVFEMEEILYELREHSAGLNAGRWDYIFSIIKKFRYRQGLLMPDRSAITMTVPFMRAYTELLVQSCHKRGAHAIGGMAAFIPSRNPEVNQTALIKVREDKEREARDGFDGTWVAHPGLVPVARECFDVALAGRANQLDCLREDVKVTAPQLLNFDIDGGKITEAGVRTNINVGLLYIESWLRGTGAAALYNLMEDAATAEISRAQVWQWLRGQHKTKDGRVIDLPRYQTLLAEELERIASLLGAERFQNGRFAEARQIFDDLVTNDGFAEFLTLIAYKHLE